MVNVRACTHLEKSSQEVTVCDTMHSEVNPGPGPWAYISQTLMLLAGDRSQEPDDRSIEIAASSTKWPHQREQSAGRATAVTSSISLKFKLFFSWRVDLRHCCYIQNCSTSALPVHSVPEIYQRIDLFLSLLTEVLLSFPSVRRDREMIKDTFNELIWFLSN